MAQKNKRSTPKRRIRFDVPESTWFRVRAAALGKRVTVTKMLNELVVSELPKLEQEAKETAAELRRAS